MKSYRAGIYCSYNHTKFISAGFWRPHCKGHALAPRGQKSDKLLVIQATVPYPSPQLTILTFYNFPTETFQVFM